MRAVAQIIACDIHPLNNLAVLNYLKGPLKHDQAAVDDWYRHWVMQGFDAIEALLRPGPYAFGAHVTVADLCLVPQVFNARRFKVDMAQVSENRRGRCRLPETPRLRQGAAGKPAGRRIATKNKNKP